jgi:hypothetical protein
MKIEQVVGIIKRIRGERDTFFSQLTPCHIELLEDNIFSHPAYAKQLFQAIAPLKIKWSSTSSIDIAFDDEALRLAKESGCIVLFIGFETIYPQRLAKSASCNIKTSADFIKAIRKIKSHGIKVIGAFLIGLEDYSHLDYLKTLLFLVSTVVRSRLLWISMTLMTPYPGTPFFERLEQESRIKTRDWSKYDLFFHVVYKPARICAPALLAWFAIMRVITFHCSSVGLILFFIFEVFPNLQLFLHQRYMSYMYGFPIFK